jgi:hypothetical protein
VTHRKSDTEEISLLLGADLSSTPFPHEAVTMEVQIMPGLGFGFILAIVINETEARMSRSVFPSNRR